MSITIGKFKLVGSEPDITKSKPVMEWEAEDLWITYSRFTPSLSDRLDNRPPVAIVYPHVLCAIDRSKGKHGEPFLIVTDEYFEGNPNVYMGLFDGSGEHTNLGAVEPETSTKDFLRRAFHYLSEFVDISGLKRLNVHLTTPKAVDERNKKESVQRVNVRSLESTEQSISDSRVSAEREYESLLLNIKSKKIERLQLFFDFREYNGFLAGIFGIGLLLFLEGQVDDHNLAHGYGKEQLDHSKFIFMYLPSIIVGFFAGYATTFLEFVKPNFISCTQELDRMKARLKSIETFYR